MDVAYSTEITRHRRAALVVLNVIPKEFLNI